MGNADFSTVVPALLLVTAAFAILLAEMLFGAKSKLSVLDRVLGLCLGVALFFAARWMVLDRIAHMLLGVFNEPMAYVLGHILLAVIVGWLVFEVCLRGDVRAKLDGIAYAGLAGAILCVLADFKLAEPVLAFGVVGAPGTGSIVADNLGRFIAIAVLSAVLLTVLQSPRTLVERGVYRAEFYALLLFAAAGMLFLVQAAELITLFLSIELLSLAIYVLTGITRQDRRSNEAALKYFIQGAFATAFLLYGMAMLYGATGSVYLSEIRLRLAASNGPGALATVGMGLIIAGFAFKVGAAPFHLWVPDVYEGAPTIVTSFMSVSVKAAGIGVLARLLVGPLSSGAEVWGGLLWGISALTIIVGNLGALAQRSVKRMLAYSSVAHTGYALVGLTAAQANPHAAESAILYVFLYTFMTLGAFAFLGWVRRPPSATHPQGSDAENLADLAGLARRRPGAALLMTVFMMSLAGLPPTAGFLGKFMLFKAAIDERFVGLAVIGIVGSLLSLYYYLRVVVEMFMRESEVQAARSGGVGEHLDFTVGLAVVFCAVLTLLLGVWQGNFLLLPKSAIGQIVGM